MDTALPFLRCPVCAASLARAGGAIRCPQGHAFDVAREGYVNLLRVPQLGDSREMLQARRRFLAAGGYAPLAAAIHESARNLLADAAAPAASAGLIVDAGCGEGYYLGSLRAALAGRPEAAPAGYLGIDIAKDAVRMAARAHPEIAFIVANLWEPLPLGDGVAVGLLNIFAPRNAGEFARVLAPGGWLLIAIPGPRHLIELRQALDLLDIEENKEQHVLDQFAAAFRPHPPRRLAYTLPLNAAAVADLVHMTPHHRHLAPAVVPALAALTDFTTTVEFTILALQRR